MRVDGVAFPKAKVAVRTRCSAPTTRARLFSGTSRDPGPLFFARWKCFDPSWTPREQFHAGDDLGLECVRVNAGRVRLRRDLHPWARVPRSARITGVAPRPFVGRRSSSALVRDADLHASRPSRNRAYAQEASKVCNNGPPSLTARSRGKRARHTQPRTAGRVHCRHDALVEHVQIDVKPSSRDSPFCEAAKRSRDDSAHAANVKGLDRGPIDLRGFHVAVGIPGSFASRSPIWTASSSMTSGPSMPGHRVSSASPRPVASARSMPAAEPRRDYAS